MDIPEITAADAMRQLHVMHKEVVKAYKGIARKRSWRPSEKAMARADYAEREAAIMFAIKTIRKETGEVL